MRRTSSAQFARSSLGFSVKASTALLMSSPEYCLRYKNTVLAASSLPCIKWLGLLMVEILLIQGGEQFLLSLGGVF